MAHGTPDWGLTAGTVTTYQLTDLAELAARLGSIVRYDRRGDIISLEDFSHGLNKWALTGSGADHAEDLSAAAARSGTFSLRLAAGSTLGRYAQASHSAPIPVASALGAEFSFTVDDNTDTWRLELFYDNGTTRWVMAAQYVHVPSPLLRLWTPSGFVTVATPAALTAGTVPFNTLKLVGDPTTSLYKRLLLNDIAVDASSYTIPTQASIEPHLMAVRITHYGQAGGTTGGYVDEVILTQNEPV
jgi:hypothetical protein